MRKAYIWLRAEVRGTSLRLRGRVAVACYYIINSVQQWVHGYYTVPGDNNTETMWLSKRS